MNTKNKQEPIIFFVKSCKYQSNRLIAFFDIGIKKVAKIKSISFLILLLFDVFIDIQGQPNNIYDYITKNDSVIYALGVKKEILFKGEIIYNSKSNNMDTLDCDFERLIEYNQAGNRVKDINIDNSVTFYEYDTVGNLVHKYGLKFDDYINNNHFFNISYQYDSPIILEELGEYKYPLDSIQDKIVNVVYKYNSIGNLIQRDLCEKKNSTQIVLMSKSINEFDKENHLINTDLYIRSDEGLLELFVNKKFYYDNNENLISELNNSYMPLKEGVNKYELYLKKFNLNNNLVSETFLSGNDTNSMKIRTQSLYDTITGKIISSTKFMDDTLKTVTSYYYVNNRLVAVKEFRNYGRNKGKTVNKLQLTYNKEGLLDKYFTENAVGFFKYEFFNSTPTTVSCNW